MKGRKVHYVHLPRHAISAKDYHPAIPASILCRQFHSKRDADKG